MPTMKATLVGLGLAGLASVAIAQATVHVDVTTPDAVGNRLGYAVKEGIRRSAAMKLVSREQDAAYRLSIVSVDADGRADRTSYSAVWLMDKSFISHTVGVCSSSRVNACAESIVADTDKHISEFARGLMDALNEAMRDMPKGRAPAKK